MSDVGGGQTTCNVAGSLVHLGPRVPDWGVRFAGDHAVHAAPGVEVHRLGKLAHDNPFGSGATARCIRCAGGLPRDGARQAVLEPLRCDRRPPLPRQTVTIEERDPLSFTSGDPSPGSARGAKRLRPDCTDFVVYDHSSAPRSVRFVTFASVPVGTKPHTRMHSRPRRLTSAFAPCRRGFRSPP
jgi:hypothetical protein